MALLRSSVDSTFFASVCLALITVLSLLFSATASAAAVQQSDGLIVLEAESGTLANGKNRWQISSDNGASGGKFIQSQSASWSQNDSGVIRFQFTVTQGGEALIYMRKRGSGKSLWISIDGKTISGPASSKAVYTPGGGWIWADGFSATKFNLNVGEHVLQLHAREQNLEIDKIVIAPLNNRSIQVGSNNIGPASGAENQPTPTPTTAADSDGDGTIDSDDNCPSEVGPTSNKGCPESTPDPAESEPAAENSAPSNAAGLVILEAEAGQISGGNGLWKKESAKSNASANGYMRSSSTNWNKTTSSSLSFNFTTSTASDSIIYLRKAGSGSSLWLTVNGKAISVISSSKAVYMPSGGWMWIDGFGATKLHLPAGQHNLKVHVRHGDLLLDKIIVAPVNSTAVQVGSSAIGPISENQQPTNTNEPITPTPVDETDSDGDGIVDSVDACPNTHGSSVNGCPVVTPAKTAGTITDFSRFPGETNYSLPVTLPACDQNAVRISTASDLRLLETSNKRVFCIAPGDYRSEGRNGPIVIRAKHGTASAPKVIQLDSSLAINDVIFDQPLSELALLPSLKFENSSHWLVDRMAFIKVDQYAISHHIALEMHASPNIVLNRLRVEGNKRPIKFFHLSHGSVVQNSLIGQSSNLTPDNVCIGLMGGMKVVGRESIYNTPPNGASDIYNVGIYNNEIVNCNDGIQLIWDPRENTRESAIYNSSSYWADYQGTKIAGNDIYIDASLRTNCYGGHSSTGLCANAENGIDIKAASQNPTNPVVIKDNKLWGFRKANGPKLSDHGAAVSIHFIAARNIEITENILWDSGAGVAMTRGISGITVHNNIIHGMFNDKGQRPIYGNTGISLSAGGVESYYGRAHDIELSYNNIINSGGPWALVNTVRSTTVDCNVVLADSAATTWFNSSTSNSSRIGKNSLYGGVRGKGLEPSGSVIRSSKNDARMAQACFKVGRATSKGGRQMCLANALSTRNSPHACSSAKWRNY